MNHRKGAAAMATILIVDDDVSIGNKEYIESVWGIGFRLIV